MINYKGAIFDLDGTILSSLHVWDKINKDFFIGRKMHMPPDYVQNISSMSSMEVAVYTKELCELEETPEELLKLWETKALAEYKTRVRLKDGVREYFEFLKKNDIKMGIVTMCNPKLYMPCLKKNKIHDFFDVVIDTDAFAKNKNFPDIYEHCAEKMGLKPSEVIVFEDIIQAIKSAQGAGMHVYAVYDAHSREDFDEIIKISDGYITDFREMINTNS